MKTFLSITSLALLSIMLAFCIGCFNSYFYPIKFKEDIISFSKESNVDAALIASVINVESSYVADAQSKKGAIGLMQIMPDTAKWLCDLSGQNFEDIDLKNQKDNIKLGCQYMAILMNSFKDVDTAICAYNAGPNKVKSWLANNDYSADGKSLKQIPYKETKEYLNKVKKNLNVYSSKYK